MQNSKGLLGGISEWMTPERGIALQGLGTILTQLDAGQPVNASPAYNALLQRQQRAERTRMLEESGLMQRFSPEQRALLAQMEPGAAQQVIAQTLFREPEQVKGVEINGRLVNPFTGAEMANFADGQDVVRVVSGADAEALGLMPDKTYEVTYAADGRLKNVSGIGGGDTKIDIDTGGGTAFGKNYFEERYGSIQEAANNASTMMGMYDVAQSALDTGLETGAGARYMADLRRLGDALGIEVDQEKMGAAEALTAITNRMALIMRSPDSGMGMPGAVSDRDLTFLKDAQVGLDRSPEGNRRMLVAFTAMERRKMDIAKLADQYIRENGQLDVGFNEAVRQYAAQNPLFTPEMFAQPEATPAPTFEIPDFGAMTTEELDAWIAENGGQ